MGFTADDIYCIFSSGGAPSELDALIKELAVNWRPAGEIIESDKLKWKPIQLSQVELKWIDSMKQMEIKP